MTTGHHQRLSKTSKQRVDRMNIVAILSIIFYLSIIIIPFIFVVRETLKEISRVEMSPEEKNKTKAGHKMKKRQSS